MSSGGTKLCFLGTALTGISPNSWLCSKHSGDAVAHQQPLKSLLWVPGKYSRHRLIPGGEREKFARMQWTWLSPIVQINSVCFQPTGSSRAAPWVLLQRERMGWGWCVKILYFRPCPCFGRGRDQVFIQDYKSSAWSDATHRKAAGLPKVGHLNVTGWRKTTANLHKILSCKKKKERSAEIAPDIFIFLIWTVQLSSFPCYLCLVYGWVIFVLPLLSAPSFPICGISSTHVNSCYKVWAAPAADQIADYEK